MLQNLFSTPSIGPAMAPSTIHLSNALCTISAHIKTSSKINHSSCIKIAADLRMTHGLYSWVFSHWRHTDTPFLYLPYLSVRLYYYCTLYRWVHVRVNCSQRAFPPTGYYRAHSAFSVCLLFRPTIWVQNASRCFHAKPWQTQQPTQAEH